jgi:hypothetical protein
MSCLLNIVISRCNRKSGGRHGHGFGNGNTLDFVITKVTAAGDTLIISFASRHLLTSLSQKSLLLETLSSSASPHVMVLYLARLAAVRSGFYHEI